MSEINERALEDAMIAIVERRNERGLHYDAGPQRLYYHPDRAPPPGMGRIFADLVADPFLTDPDDWYIVPISEGKRCISCSCGHSKEHCRCQK